MSAQTWSKEAGRALSDRALVAALVRAFPPSSVDDALVASGSVEQRRRALPARLVVYFVLALWALPGPDNGYEDTMRRLIDAMPAPRGARGTPPGALPVVESVSPRASSLSRARLRLGALPLRLLFESVAGVGTDTGARAAGLRTVTLSVADVEVPATTPNAHLARGVRWMVAADSDTGALLAASFGPRAQSDAELFRELPPVLGPTHLVALDEPLGAPELVEAVLSTGAHVVHRATGPEPPSGTSPMRRIARPAGTGTALQTDLLDAEAFPAAVLASAFRSRWRCRALTELVGGRSALRSKDPIGIAQELWAMFAVYQVFQTMRMC